MAIEREQYIVDSRGRKKAVILPIKRYRQILEDLEDLAAMAERDGEPTVPWEEVKKRLRADGLLSD